jgi:hypothetical protein
MTLIMLIYCFNKYVQCQYKHEWQIKVKKLHIFSVSTCFVWWYIIRICVLHTSLVLFGCISPDMCIAYTLVSRMFSVFSFVKFLSCMDNATSYQTACCGVIDNVAILHWLNIISYAYHHDSYNVDILFQQICTMSI